MFKPANPEACYGPFLEQRVIWLCWKHLASHCSHWAVCPSLSKSQWLGMVCGVAEALRENPPHIQSGGPTCPSHMDDNGTEIQCIGVQKKGKCVLDSKQQLSILLSLLLLLGQVFNEMCLCAYYAKIWGLKWWNHQVGVRKRICNIFMWRQKKLHDNIL